MPYYELMKASGRQLSLAYQIFPFGAVIGKACERFNNPPLIYWGSELKCLNANPTIDGVKSLGGKKMTAAQIAKYKTQLSVAHMKDRGVPFFQRVAAVALYITMLYFTAILSSDNVAEMGVRMFSFLIALAYSKAVCEFLLPALCIAVVGALLAAARNSVVKTFSFKDFLAPSLLWLPRKRPRRVKDEKKKII